MSKDFFDNMISSQSVDYGELMIYDNQFVEPLESDMNTAKLTIADNAARITTLEQQIPGGGTGKGTYLNLGGTPERYPRVDECVGQGTDETGFVVVAKPDGIYFYNPVTKTFIPPKKGGGNVAIQGQFPDVFDDSHSINHAGKITRSGIFLADYREIGITAWTYPEYACQLMVTSHESGAEQHVVIGKEGLAYKIFLPGQNNAEWVHYQGTPGGGGGPSTPLPFPFIDLTDVPDNYAGMGGKVLAVKTTEDGIEFIDAPPGGGGTPVPGKETFLELLDTPQTYTGHRGRMVVVNDTETALTYVDRDASIVDQVFNAFKIGQPVIDSKSVSSGALVSDQTVMQGELSGNQLLVMTGTSARTANLPEIAPKDTDTIMDSQTRAGRLYYIHNQTDVTKRFRPSPGDVFMIDGAEVTTSQSLVGKSTAIVFPTHDGTKGVWYVLSQNKISAASGASNFTELNDTPSSFIGMNDKIVAVKPDASGLEFIDPPVIPSDIMSEAEVEAKVAQILGGGLNLVNGNGLGGAFAQTSGDVSNTAVASGSILVGSGSSTGKKFTMPMIVARDVTTLSNSEVRAGRLTYIINMGSQPRTIEKVSGVRFFVNGGHTDTVQTIKAGVCMVFMPGIWGDGTKSWMPIGQFNVAEASGVTSNDLYTGQVKIANRAILYVAYDYNGDIAADKMANNPFIIATGAAGNRILTLPTIMPKLTETLTSTQVREGYRLTVYNQAAGPRTLRLQAGQFFWKDWATNTLDYAIPSKHMEDFLACKVSNNYVWIPMSRRHINNDQARFVQTDKDFLDGIQNGDKYLHANAMVTPASVITSSSFTAEQAATTNNLIIRTTTGATTGTMPAIVPVTSTGIPAGSVRLGFEMTISNHNASANVTINYQNGSQLWNNGSFGATSTLSPNSWIKLVAVNTSGSVYGWAKVASGTH